MYTFLISGDTKRETSLIKIELLSRALVPELIDHTSHFGGDDFEGMKTIISRFFLALWKSNELPTVQIR